MTPPPHPAPAAEPLLDLHAVYLDPYSEIVQPDRVITFPRYFLDRWVALFGVSKAWLYIAFRQASYLAGRSQAISLPGSRLAQMAAMGRSTFWSTLGTPALLAWFVNKAATTSRYYYDSQQGAIRQAPNAYQVLRDIPLTPADQAHLRAWLHTQSAETGAAGCRAALAAAQTAPLPDLLVPAPGRPALAEPGPLSVFDLATQAFGLTHLTASEEKELRAASRALYQRLIPSDKHHVFVTHYFFEHWLPRLGHGSAMLVTDLRDQCWEDPRKKTRRTEVLVEGGFQTLTARYGVKGYTIREWLTADAARRQCKAAHVRQKARERRHSVALRPVASAPAEAWTLKQFFSVRGRRGRDQRAPNRVDLLFTDIALEEPLIAPPMAAWPTPLARPAASDSDQMMKPRLTVEDQVRKPGHTVGDQVMKRGLTATDQVRKLGLIAPTKRGNLDTPGGVSEETWRVLNSIKLCPLSGNSWESSSSSAAEPARAEQEEEAPPAPRKADWDLAALIQAAHVAPRHRRAVRAAGRSGADFAALVLWGIAAGKTAPGSWAAAVAADAEATWPAVFQEIAAGGPDATTHLFQALCAAPAEPALEADLLRLAAEFRGACGDAWTGFSAPKNGYAELRRRAGLALTTLGLSLAMPASEPAEPEVVDPELQDASERREIAMEREADAEPIYWASEAGRLWQTVLASLKRELLPVTYLNLKEFGMLVAVEGDQATLAVARPCCELYRAKFLPLVHRALGELGFPNVRLELVLLDALSLEHGCFAQLVALQAVLALPDSGRSQPEKESR